MSHSFLTLGAENVTGPAIAKVCGVSGSVGSLEAQLTRSGPKATNFEAKLKQRTERC